MHCEICRRSPSERLPFYCTLCARNAIYEPRLRMAQVLLQNEVAAATVENQTGITEVAAEPSRLLPNTNSREVSPVWIMQQAYTDQTSSSEKTEQIATHVKALRNQTEAMKLEIAQRRARITQRRADLKSVREELVVRKTTATESLERALQRMEHRWDAMHAKTLESRVFLCREAAQLYGLQRRKTRKERAGGDAYLIGGTLIADLRDLDCASPIQVTTSTTHLAHLVHLISHYLSIRLPAEITLAHRDYPLPTIFSPGASYTLREVPYPSSTPSHSSNNSPSGSHLWDLRTSVRPRPLHLNRKLSVLAKEDPAAYGLFVEGITLLAWDIAWVCQSQGLPIGRTSWEDSCAMGKNLWQLLVADPLVPWTQPHSTPFAGSAMPRPLPPHLPAPHGAISTPVQLGHFSHGTAHSFLAAANGSQYMQDWPWQSPFPVIDKVKAMLLSERTGAGWEILEGNEWEEAPAPRATGKDGRGTGEDEGAAEGVEADSKARGTSGWTKLKSRGTG